MPDGVSTWGPSPQTRKIFQVGELTRCIKHLLESEVGRVWVEGELSNLSRPASGHLYFTLKDSSSQLRCALFRGQLNAVPFALRDGLQVRLHGDLSVYARRGEYQLLVRAAEPAGHGALQAAFEELKQRLAAEGLFDPGRKRPIPLLPQHVGIVTSPTGAAIRDILQVTERRFPNLHIIVAPARVQGTGAADDLCAGLAALNRLETVDVILLARGGGSLEDLWPFNEERVARAIAASRIAVISAVGHETDFTISDFVADLRAPTPSAAAEMVVGRKQEFVASLAHARRRMRQALHAHALILRNRFTAAARSYVFREPGHRVRRYTDRLAQTRLRARHALECALREHQQRTDEQRERLRHGMARALQETRILLPRRLLRLAHSARRETAAARLRMTEAAGRSLQSAPRLVERRSAALDRLAAQLQALSPLAVLRRGYSITRDSAGHVLRQAAAVKGGDTIETVLAAGRLRSRVVETRRAPDE